MKKFLRSPLAHFLIFGSLLFAGEKLLLPTDEIVLGADEVARIKQNWQRQTGRAPTDTEFEAAVQTRVDEEILLREALAQQLDIRDSVARERLLRNMRFAFPERADSDARLLEDARRLGMNRRDRVVRLRLVELMRQQLSRKANLAESELQDYVARHAERYAQPARVAFHQVFFDRDRRGAQLHADAARALAQLRAQQPVQGDAFLLGDRFAAASPDEMARRFGAAFAASVTKAPAGQWSGPYESPYGLHLVWVDDQQAAQAPDLAAVRAQAAYAALSESEQAAVQQGLVQLRRHYRVDVETRS